MLVVVILGMSTHTTHAATSGGDMIGGIALDAIGGILSVVFNVILGAVGFILALAGALLNISMYLTTHLGMFIDKTDAIYTTWNIVRDLSSILLIFIILYASIQMITGMKSADFGGMIKNIIIVGVLINFSFFFCRVMIDASNIISLQFYNAIAPSNNASTPYTYTDFPSLVKKIATDGGVSDAVMGQLNLTSWFGKGIMKTDSQTSAIANSFSEDFHIVILSIGGIIVASITSLSFVAISTAALLRIAMLIFLIGFSPIWIASWAMPSLKKLTEQWTKQFYAQLVFLPTYMAFLYVALRVIVALQLNSIGDANATTGLASAINLFVGFGIAIVLLNIPIVAAIGVTAAVGGDSGMIEKFSNTARGWARTATVGAAGAGGGWAARQVIGGTAATLDKKLSNSTFFGDTVLGRDIRAATTGKVAASKFGTKRSEIDYRKEAKDAAKKGAEITRRSEFNRVLTGANTAQIGTALHDMGEKERLSLGGDNLKNVQVLKHLRKSDFDAIRKSDDFTDDDKREIEDARLNAFRNAINNHEGDVVGHMLNNLDMDDVVPIINQVYSTTGSVPDYIVEHLSQGKLESLAKEGIDDQAKRSIGRQIYAWHAAGGRSRHSAYGFVGKNFSDWT